uniref:Iron-containing alcohol dehydrogenase n=1 Tax=Candidatus Caldatribacterium californiense TaxID=1454726 RepID=A0A7V4DED0_9BACT
MEESFVFRLPQEIYFGPGEGRRVGEHLGRFGKRPLVVVGQRFARESGILEDVLGSLARHGLEAVVFSGVPPEPTLEVVDEGIRMAREARCDSVVALGGGSVLDCGKAIAGVLPNGESVVPYFEGAPLARPGLPWIALPTTAGTGSEMTNNAVLTDATRKLKKSLRSPFLVARVAIIDPTFTHSLSPYHTAASGVDALVQAIEAYTSPRANVVTDVLALEAMRLLWEYLPQAVREGENAFFRKQVAKGSMLSAMAFANASSGACHGLAHMVGPEFAIPHGEACGLLLPPVIRFNKEVLKERYRDVALCVGLQGGEREDWGELLARAFEDFVRGVGLRTRLRDFGVPREALGGVVREERIGRSILENPRPMTPEDLRTLLEEVW